MGDFEVVPLGDACLSVVFESRIDPRINDRCIRIASALAGDPECRDIVPAFHAVAVYFNPISTDRRSLAARLDRIASSELGSSEDDLSKPLEVPVRYGGTNGPDLAAVAAFGGCSEAEAVGLHTSREYRVFMLGFLPGFAYMGSVDERIAMPRLDTPRLRVAAGSVGIAGSQTGIYPFESPGGWRIIGQTDSAIFDANREEPFLFKPGQRVRFVSI